MAIEPIPSLQSEIDTDLRGLKLKLQQWREQDHNFDWTGLFNQAQLLNYQQMKQAAEDEPQAYQSVAVQRVAIGKNLVKNTTIGLFTMAAIILLQRITLSLVAGVDGAKNDPDTQKLLDVIQSISQFMMLLVGAAALLTLVTGAFYILTAAPGSYRVVDGALNRVINLIVPAPITYHSTVEPAAEGEVQARVWRKVPHIKDGQLVMVDEALGEWSFSDGEDTASAVSQWEEILTQLDQLEESAAVPYRDVLTQAGLDGENRIATETELRMRVEDAQERRQLNQGMIETMKLSGQAREQQRSEKGQA